MLPTDQMLSKSSNYYPSFGISNINSNRGLTYQFRKALCGFVVLVTKNQISTFWAYPILWKNLLRFHRLVHSQKKIGHLDLLWTSCFSAELYLFLIIVLYLFAIHTASNVRYKTLSIVWKFGSFIAQGTLIKRS